MPLNVVSNYAANVAHRNLQATDTAASDSLAKLSIGKRVVSARDDAASMAIGSRMESEVMGLKQAVINADTTLTFKVGTGTVAAEDDLTFTISGVTSTLLGVNGGDILNTTNTETALTNISTAIDTLNTARADIGAAQNRLDYATANLRIAIENSEAARSTLLDLDLAAEMTNFTSKQVLMQSGVAMLAQANQLPQNLLRLLQ